YSQQTSWFAIMTSHHCSRICSLLRTKVRAPLNKPKLSRKRSCLAMLTFYACARVCSFLRTKVRAPLNKLKCKTDPQLTSAQLKYLFHEPRTCWVTYASAF